MITSQICNKRGNGVRLYESTRKSLSFSCERDRMTIHSVGLGSCTREKESFYAKINVSVFVNFEVDRLKKKMMKKIFKTEVWHFSYVTISVYFTYFEGLIW